MIEIQLSGSIFSTRSVVLVLCEVTPVQYLDEILYKSLIPCKL